MKSIDERVVQIIDMARKLTPAKRTELIRLSLLGVARDQRHACAEAVGAIHLDARSSMIDVNVARQVVMNAEIK